MADGKTLKAGIDHQEAQRPVIRGPASGRSARGMGGVIDEAWFHGALLLDDVVFLHKPSRTAIFADLTKISPNRFSRHTGPGGSG